MKKRISTIILIIIFLAGLSLLLYPSVSDYWNSFHQSKAIAGYTKIVSSLDEEEYKEVWENAKEYNKKLLTAVNRFFPQKEEKKEYQDILNLNGHGIMGYLEIPSINCALTIYHGTDAAVLQTAVGHIEGTSVPVGGKGTHCVLSGHRGLPSAKLFSNLDDLEEGDIFILRVLDECLTYEVDQIRIVEPDNISDLEISPEHDLCTLVTCTPYGVNSHRMLVRGHRVENSEEVKIVSEAIQIDPMIVLPFVVVPMLLIMIGYLLLGHSNKR